MAGTYTCKDGDMVDLIAFNTYGVTDGATEAILAANPALPALGVVLAAGTVVILPDLPTPDVAPTINLWD